MGETHRQVLAALSVGDQLRVRPGRSLMSMNVCLLFVPVTTEKHVNYCSKLMLILYRPITAHRRCVLDRPVMQTLQQDQVAQRQD